MKLLSSVERKTFSFEEKKQQCLFALTTSCASCTAAAARVERGVAPLQQQQQRDRREDVDVLKKEERISTQ